MIDKIKFISAGAGSGKTFSLTENLYTLLSDKEVASSRVIATTFTIKSAAELRERVRQKLLEKGDSQLACQMEDALIGTVNSVCGQLLERFSFEAGLSPELSVVDEKQSKNLFNQAIEENVSAAQINNMNQLSARLGHDDWCEDVKKIAELARSNNIAAKSLQKMGEKSVDSMMENFPSVTTRDLNEQLETELNTAIANIDGEQKNTKEFVVFIESAQRNLQLKTLPWSDWVKLSKPETKPKPAKKFQSYASAIAQIAMDYDKHPTLHNDIRDYIGGIFNVAADSLEHFQSLKKQRGLIDFVDQEQLLLNLLDDASVQSRLASELDLLMVDEFQDTSPIQLALFLKLASCAKKVYFVGDIKQSIYGFRGSDPSLMLAVVNEIQKQSGCVEILENSYRSCESLVKYTNAAFISAFENTLNLDQIALKHKRKNIDKQAVVEHWKLQGSNKNLRSNALAVAIKKKIAGQSFVFDDVTKSLRKVQASDISILMRSNDNVDDLAAVLTTYGIPVQTAQSHLITTAEASLVLACLRRLIDQFDTLASAEIISLTKSDEPEVWLKDRLAYLSGNNPSEEWGESDNSLLSALKTLRKSSSVLSPIETVQQIIINLNIRSIVSRWGPTSQVTMQRLNNLDQLLESVIEYENFCLTTGGVASLSGLMLWWNELASNEEDEQACVKGQDAVQIMTYHSAKGLEWPIVILCDLNLLPRTRTWSPRVIGQKNNVNIHAPLHGREISYWPWPFGQQKTGIPIKGIIEATPVGVQALDDAKEEEKRLLYVGATRARDSLVLTTDQDEGMNKEGWLALTNAGWLLPDSKNTPLPDGSVISTDCLSFQSEEVVKNVDSFQPQWFGDNPQRSEKIPASISPSAAMKEDGATTGELITFGDRLMISGVVPDMAIFGNALHAVIAAKCINKNYHQNDAKSLLRGFEVDQYISVEDALLSADRLIRYVDMQYAGAKLYAEYPVEHKLDNGQKVRGWIDLLIETGQGWIICDHKSSPKKKSELKAVALEYSGQLRVYRDAVNAASDKPVLSTIIHFPLSGCVVGVN
jgi:ATP-dependent helicase/nuclease subunit A